MVGQGDAGLGTEMQGLHSGQSLTGLTGAKAPKHGTPKLGGARLGGARPGSVRQGLHSGQSLTGLTGAKAPLGVWPVPAWSGLVR